MIYSQLPQGSQTSQQVTTKCGGDTQSEERFKVCWGLEQQEAFETLQRLCTESPILAYADFKAPFVLHTDASGDGLGTVLYQVQDGQKRVIAYASRSLSKSERNYPVHKLEFLALKWAVTDKFHEYLYSSEFQVYTDNNPLTYVLTTAKLARAPGRRSRRTTKPHVDPIDPVDTPTVLFEETHSELSSPSSPENL